VLTAVHTIVGGQYSMQGPPNALAWDGLSVRALPPPLPPKHRAAAVVSNHDVPPTALTEGNLSESSLSPVLARATRRVVAISLETVPEVKERKVQRRLEDLESQLMHVLDDLHGVYRLDTDVVHTGQAPDDGAPTPTPNETPAAQHAELPDQAPA